MSQCLEVMEELSKEKKDVLLKRLEEVVDPELYVDIVSLGLVYHTLISEDGSKLKIIMTLTFPGCPYGETLKDQVREKAEELDDYKEVEVDITFEPPWSPEKIDPQIRAALNL